MNSDPGPIDETALIYLRALADRWPTPDAVLAEIARLSAALTLPQGGRFTSSATYTVSSRS